MDGADAILLEPYSVESLQTISQIADNMKTERVRVRVQAALLRVRMQGALRLLVREIAAQAGPGCTPGKIRGGRFGEPRRAPGNVFRARRIGPRNAFTVLRSPPGCLPRNPRDSLLSPRRHLSGVSQRVRRHCSVCGSRRSGRRWWHSVS